MKNRMHPHYYRLCNNSNAVVLLSEGFRLDLEYITGFKCKNIFSIPNPLSYTSTDEPYKKSKTILYVGRSILAQKKWIYF